MWTIIGFVLLTIFVAFLLNQYLFNTPCSVCQHAEEERREAYAEVLAKTSAASLDDLVDEY